MDYHRIIRLVVAFAIGISLALYAYHRATDPEPLLQKAREEAVVLASREILHEIVAPGEALHVVDPLAPDRVIGKAYIYPAADGWEVSGHYRRQGGERWSPFLMAIDSNLELVTLKVRDNDPRMVAAAADDPRISVSRFPASGNQPQDQPDD